MEENGQKAPQMGELQDQIQACMMQRQNLEAIFNSVADGIIAVDLDLRVSNLNEAAQAITGYTREEAVGESCLEILGLQPNCGELRQVFSEHREVDGLQAHIVNRHGRRHHIGIGMRVLRDEQGSDRGLVAIVRDNTEIVELRSQVQGQERFVGLVGKNHRMHEIYQLVEDLTDSDATVLILGESGTGKELVAEAIHKRSRRCEQPFVKVNCSALSENLLESELFGHVKGAFTGAVRDKVGRFEKAAGGTIFLDEIGDVSLVVQIKLLRVLQEREIERVGSSETIQINTRVVAATNRDLQQAMQQGQFREDLYYRLNVMPIILPALRERKEDLPLLVAHFIEKFNVRTARSIEGIDPQALSKLMDYDWPGNVRELENVIEHAFIKCRARVLQVECLPVNLQHQAHCTPAIQAVGGEKQHVLSALQECQWNRSVAAERLGMHRTTLWRKLKEWDMLKE